MHHYTDRIAHNTAFVTLVVKQFSALLNRILRNKKLEIKLEMNVNVVI